MADRAIRANPRDQLYLAKYRLVPAKRLPRAAGRQLLGAAPDATSWRPTVAWPLAIGGTDRGVADAFLDAHGEWPTGTLLDAPAPGVDDTWAAIESALRNGSRGLPGGSSLARLLTRDRGVRPRYGCLLSEKQIIAWADAFFAAHGRWPAGKSQDAPAPDVNDSWSSINLTLRLGHRGLPGNSSLARLLKRHRGATVVQTPVIGARDRGVGRRFLRRSWKVAKQNVPALACSN